MITKLNPKWKTAFIKLQSYCSQFGLCDCGLRPWGNEHIFASFFCASSPNLREETICSGGRRGYAQSPGSFGKGNNPPPCLGGHELLPKSLISGAVCGVQVSPIEDLGLIGIQARKH